jgi:hypothetical protein
MCPIDDRVSTRFFASLAVLATLLVLVGILGLLGMRARLSCSA